MITQITKAELPFFEEITEKVSRMPQPDIPMNHIFPEGMYIRQRLAKAGTILVGKRHRHETTSILLYGVLSIYIDNNGTVEQKTGPCVWKTPALTRRITYSVTDTVLATVHPNMDNGTDLDKIEGECVIQEQEFLELKDIKKIGGEK
jgi:hypothetical protein